MSTSSFPSPDKPSMSLLLMIRFCKPSSFLLKLLNSAVANINYTNENENFEGNNLYVKTIYVDGGPTLKRIRPAAMGRAVPIRKRMSHITVIIGKK